MQLKTAMAAQELIQYLRVVRSVSSKNNETQGVPQSLTLLPAL